LLISGLLNLEAQFLLRIDGYESLPDSPIRKIYGFPNLEDLRISPFWKIYDFFNPDAKK